MNQESDYMTTGELSIMINVSLRTIEKWIERKELPGLLKAGRQWRIKKTEIFSRMRNGSLLIEKQPETRKMKNGKRNGL